MQYHAGSLWKEKCHQARKYWKPSERYNSQTTTCKNTGTRERHMWFSLRCGSYCTPVPTVHNKSTTSQKQTDREKRRRLQQEYKGALELARLQIGLGDVHWEWPDQCAAWNLDFIQEGMRELCMETTTATGCSLGVKHPLSGKLVAQKWRIASTSKKVVGQNNTFMSRRSSTP